MNGLTFCIGGGVEVTGDGIITWGVASLYLVWACFIAYGFKVGWNQFAWVGEDGEEKQDALVEVLCIIFWPYFVLATLARGTLKIGTHDDDQ